MMSNSEDDLSVVAQSLNSSSSPTSDREKCKVVSRIAEKISINNVKDTDSVTEPTNMNQDGVICDDNVSPCTSRNNKSIQSVSSRKSSQSSSDSEMRCASKKRAISSSSNSLESENDDTIDRSQKFSQSVSSPSKISSQSEKLKLSNSSPSSFQTSSNYVRKSLNSDSDEDIIASRKSKPMRLFESDENESDAGAVSESCSKILMNEEDAKDLEEPKQKKKRKKRLVLSSDGSDSNEENDPTPSVIHNTYSEEERDNEPESSNLTTKEKRRRKLEKLNEQKRCEFAKLAEKNEFRNSKKNEDVSLIRDNCKESQPQVEESQTKSKKFLLLSDDDLSDSRSAVESPVHSEKESYEKEKDTKSKKKKINKETKNSKKRQNQEKKLDGTEGAANRKIQKESRSRIPKSDASSKKLKQSQQKSKKQREAMLEIKSTTQKMIREGRIALPYHQPKQHSLDEFLQRRSNVPFLPLRASYDILSIAGERLMKKEEEIAEFYKSESEHSEGEQIIDDTQNHSTSQQNRNETNAVESSAISCELFLARHDVSEGKALNTNESDLPEDVSSTERVVSIMNNENLEEFGSRDHPKQMICNSPDLTSGEVGNDKSDVLQMPAFPNHNDEQMNKSTITVENTAATATDQNSLKVVKLGSVVNSSLNSAVTESDPICKEIDKSLEEGGEAPENINQVITMSHNVHKENDVTDVTTILPRRPEFAKENEVFSLEDDDNCAPAQDTEDFDLEIENSCSAEANVESGVTTSIDPLLQADPETMRKKNLEFLSSRNIRFSEPKLRKDDTSIIQFEIDSVPESAGIQSFIKKFANHVTAKKKIKKQSDKINVTNVQTDSQGEIIDIIKETLTLKSLDDDDNNDVEDKFRLPGSKYSFFKDTMLKTLISRRTADWNKYQDEKYSSFDRDDAEYGDASEEKEEEEATIQIPNFKPYHPEDEPGDEDLVEDDVDMTVKLKKKKSKYIDEEAEVDFDEDENIMGASDEEVDLEDECSIDEGKHQEENSEDESETDVKNGCDSEKEEDVDSDEELLNNMLKECEERKSPIKKISTPSKLFKNNITGENLENKVLRLEYGSQLDDFSNTQIFDICSGKFATQIVPPVSNDTSQFLIDSQFPDDSQDFNLSMQETNDGFVARDDKTSNVVNKNSFVLSDNESDTEELFNKRRNAAIQLEDSDNDDESVNSIDDREGKDLGNENESEEDDAVEAEPDDDNLDAELEYNSEEEIVDYKNAGPNEFFENEAELSESEWGSEDENEKDLDYLEKEAGDDDDIDNDRLKEELGRIHMRHLMDDDQKNIRLLQEILLEDGDLHADGQRNRKFQWKNLDGESFLKNFFGDSDNENALIDDNDLNDDEKSKNWRQMRHEREMFLSKQEKNNDLLLSAEDEKQSFTRISNTAKVITQAAFSAGPRKPASLKSPNAKFSFHTKSKCGSFLSRGQQILNRIANNVGESKEGNIQGAKNSRNFVFAAKSVKEVVLDPAKAENQVKKRKISSKSVMACKRLKLVDGVPSQTAPPKPGFLTQLSLAD